VDSGPRKHALKLHIRIDILWDLCIQVGVTANHKGQSNVQKGVMLRIVDQSPDEKKSEMKNFLEKERKIVN
jgi:hypothetical protein